MKRTKSIIALLMACIMTIGITACGSGSTMDANTDTSVDNAIETIENIPSPEGLPRGNSGKTGTTSSGIPRGNSGKTKTDPETALKRYGEIETLVKAVKTPTEANSKNINKTKYGTVDWSMAAQGYITFTATGANRGFILQGPNGVQSFMDVKKDETIKVILMDGTGKYQYVITNITTSNGKTSYPVQYKNSFSVSKFDTDLAMYLVSTPWGDYENAPNATAKAKELWDNNKTQLENVQAIADWVGDNLKYDSKLKQGSCSVYVNPDKVIENGGGVCNEHSKLLSAMLRSQGIPAFYIIGNEGTHAWVNAWVELETSTKDGVTYSKGAWVLIEAVDGNMQRVTNAGYDTEDIHYAN